MNVYFTFDYELFFGSNTGTALNGIVKPTNELITIASQHNVKFTFFVDSGYLIKLIEYKDKYEYVQKEYDLVFSQIKQLDKLGHSIQLHIHPHWEDSYFNGKKWIIDTSRYRLHQFNEDEIEDIVYRYKKVLTDIIGDKVFAYRAGGWCIQPFDKISKALKKNNIWLDSTVFYGGENLSQTHFYDFKNAPKKDMWHFENDSIVEETEGFFTEVPISSIKLNPLFFWRFALTKKIASDLHKIYGDGKPVGASKKDILKMLVKSTYSCVSCDGYKSKLLEKSYSVYQKSGNKNFVIIGHPKAQTTFSLKNIKFFLSKYKKAKAFNKVNW